MVEEAGHGRHETHPALVEEARPLAPSLVGAARQRRHETTHRRLVEAIARLAPPLVEAIARLAPPLVEEAGHGRHETTVPSLRGWSWAAAP